MKGLIKEIRNELKLNQEQLASLISQTIECIRLLLIFLKEELLMQQKDWTVSLILCSGLAKNTFLKR